MKNKEFYVVGGYYDPGVYLSWDENEWGEPVLKDLGDFKPFASVEMYNVQKDLDKLLDLGFLHPFPEWFWEGTGMNVDEAPVELVAKELYNFEEGDDLAGLALFDNEKEASEYLAQCLEEIKEAEKNFEKYDQVQDRFGFYVYRMKPKDKEN